MASSAEPARRYTASGREIEPHFVVAPLPSRVGAQGGISIRIRGLEKSFGSTSVLEGIDLEIAAGSFVAIVGKSGCGKSTLLRLLTGLEQPSAGSTVFEDAAGAEQAAHSRIMFQEPRLLPWEKVADNVGVGLGGRRDEGAALAALADVQLPEKAQEWPSRLSGGQRQRVALARAVVSRPNFLALDEPLGALDALTRITMQKLLERVWVDQGFTALLVTHDVSEAVALADRVIVLDGGRVALDLAIDLPRPRERASARAATYEQRLLKAISGLRLGRVRGYSAIRGLTLAWRKHPASGDARPGRVAAELVRVRRIAGGRACSGPGAHRRTRRAFLQFLPDRAALQPRRQRPGERLPAPDALVGTVASVSHWRWIGRISGTARCFIAA